MKLYLNELAPWERKKEYYHTIQLGKDVRSQTEAIDRQTKAFVAAPLPQVLGLDALPGSWVRAGKRPPLAG